MATTSSPTLSSLPAGFASPFKRIEMQERIDDALACIAILTHNNLGTINAAAIKAGHPPHGPAWVTYPLIAKLLSQMNSQITPFDYKEITSVAALPDIAILLVNYDPDTEIGRHVVWHHVRATDKTPSFHYVIDPAPWLDAKHHITTDMRHLRLVGGYYIEIKLPTYASVKGR